MPIDQREFRNALGQYPTGVCVVTASPENITPFGVTVNSFASLSLTPPLVLWSVQNDSDNAKAWEITSHYVINILSSDQKELSVRYSKRGDQNLRSADYTISAIGNPLINSCLVSLECKITDRHEGGDHTILVGEVLELTKNNDKPTPLVFMNGEYHTIA